MEYQAPGQPSYFTTDIPPPMVPLDTAGPAYTLGTGNDFIPSSCPAPVGYAWNNVPQYHQPIFYPGHSNIPTASPGTSEAGNDDGSSGSGRDSSTPPRTRNTSKPKHDAPSTFSDSDSQTCSTSSSSIKQESQARRSGGKHSSSTAAAARLRSRNRVAASTYRSRQRSSRSDLITRSETLERESRDLCATQHTLIAERRLLRQMLSQHASCDCQLIQQYLLSPPASRWIDGRVADLVRGKFASLDNPLGQGRPTMGDISSTSSLCHWHT